MDKSAMRQRIEAFHERHGADCVDIDGYRVYSDGAYRDIDPIGILAEPDSDLFVRSQRVIEYWEERTDRAVDAFDEAKDVYASFCRAAAHEPSVPATPWAKEQATEHLKKLRAEVHTCQAQLKNARAELKRHEPPHSRERAKRNARQRDDAAELLRAVSQIRI